MTEEKSLRSGPDVIRDFLEHIADNVVVDEATLEAIRALHKSGNLTKNRLLNSLSEHLDDGKAKKT